MIVITSWLISWPREKEREREREGGGLMVVYNFLPSVIVDKEENDRG